MRLIVCLDTNVVVSALIWKGMPWKVLSGWIDNKFDMALSKPIFKEYEAIFKRLALLVKEQDFSLWLKKINEDSLFYDTAAFQGKLWCRDPKDDEFIACSLASEADYLITGDKDLLVLDGQFSFPIIKPKKFLSILDAKK